MSAASMNDSNGSDGHGLDSHRSDPATRMRVMVTGGAGFIGSHVVDRLIADGHSVLVVDDLSSGKRENLNPEARFEEIDIRDAGLSKLVEEFKPDVVSHHAAQASVQRAMRDPAFDVQVNLLGSLNLLDACAENGVRRIIYVSTAAVYGEPQGLPVPESHPIRPLSGYGISKYALEHYLPIYAGQHGLDYSILRYANVYGPRQDPHGEAGVVAIFAGKILAGEPCIIFGDGEQSRDFVYVEDIAAVNALLLDGQGKAQTFNIGTGELTTVNTLFDTMCSLCALRVSRRARSKPARRDPKLVARSCALKIPAELAALHDLGAWFGGHHGILSHTAPCRLSKVNASRVTI